MSVKAATCSAIAFSVCTLLACLLAISGIYNDVQNIWSELDNEISSIRARPRLASSLNSLFSS